MRARCRALGLLPVLTLWCLLAPSLGAGKPHPSFAGTWRLNPQLSRSPGQRYGARPGGRPGREPRGGVGGEAGGEFPRETMGGGSQGLGELLRPKARLSITQADTLLTVSDDAGWIRDLIPSGLPMREELGQGGPAEVMTRWKGDKLVAERRLDEGGTYSESYELNRKSGRLSVTISFKTPRMQRALSGIRVYDRE
ncbi:MAG TPA: hypothetical protein VGP61_11690 [Gemmatimonadales bacterium]|nr:hypothetical protein [Gemmatimonadales bacterium]